MYFICVERSTYWLAWIGLTVYALWQFADACQMENYFYRLNPQDFKDGFLSKNLYDTTDFEWQSFKKLYINYWYIVFLHFTLSNIFTAYSQPGVSYHYLDTVVIPLDCSVKLTVKSISYRSSN